MLHLLLTNDDGIEEAGIRALYQACEGLGKVTVVAPSHTCSGIGHAVTTARPLAVSRYATDWFSVNGTPADCSRIAARSVAPDADWILAGINHGANLGVDVYTSGTVAAAREAAILGFRAVAFSQYVKVGLNVDWEWTAGQVRQVFEQLLASPPAPGEYFNVNLPHLPPAAEVPEPIYCGVDPSPFDVQFRREDSEERGDDWLAHYEGVYAKRARIPGSDIDVCFEGAVAISRLTL
jgi:5'-nucleotidase